MEKSSRQTQQHMEKSLGREHSGHVESIVRRPVWLECSEHGEMVVDERGHGGSGWPFKKLYPL